MKIEKGWAKKSNLIDTGCFVYFMGDRARLNAVSRDSLGDPEFISIEYEEHKILISASTNENDYRLTRASTGQRFLYIGALKRVIGEIPDKTKIFGTFENGKLVFPLS